MFDLLREIVQTMRNNKLRTFLTGFAVAWGIFMLIILLGMARGVTNSFNSNRSSERSSRLNVYQGVTTEPFRGYKEGRMVQPNMDDISNLQHDLPGIVEDVASYKYLPSTTISSSKDYVNASPQGVFPAEKEMYDLTISHGRFINDADIRYNRKVMVLGKENAKLLFGSEDKAVGQRLSAMGLSWLVVGVHEHRWITDIYIPFTTAMSLAGTDGKVSNLQVKLKGLSTQEDADRAETAVRENLAKAHTYSPDDKNALHIYNRFSSYLKESTAFNILNMSVWIIGIFTLLSGIVGVSNIMFVSVRERTHEIGIRRAIGAKPSNILTQIVTESVAITTMFGYIGIVLGMAVMQIASNIIGENDVMKNPTISLSIAIEVTIVLIIAGALAGLFPAIKATKVKPVEALRDE